MKNGVRKKQDGSILIVALFFTFVFAVVAINIMRNTTFFCDISCLHQKYTYQLYATEALLHYGIAWSRKNYETFAENNHKIITFDTWPPALKSDYSGRLSLEKNDQKKEKIVQIYATLYKQQEVIIQLSCTTTFSKNTHIVIHDWHIHSS